MPPAALHGLLTKPSRCSSPRRQWSHKPGTSWPLISTKQVVAGLNWSELRVITDLGQLHAYPIDEVD